jgi:hypothetical protein
MQTRTRLVFGFFGLLSSLAATASAQSFGQPGGFPGIGGSGGVIGGGAECRIQRSQPCATNPGLPLSFDDTADDANLDPDRCSLRARATADACQDPAGASTSAAFVENGVEERVTTYVVPAPPSRGPGIGVARAYRAVTGEHFYTVSYAEAVNAGFTIEAYPYFTLAVEDFQQAGLVPFYRCNIPSAGKHFYTQSATCEGAPAINEGSMGLIANDAAYGAVPLYRLYNPLSGDHLYTVASAEITTAGAAGWRLEGIAGYVWLY